MKLPHQHTTYFFNMSRIHNFCYKYFAVDLQSDVMSEEMNSMEKYLAQSQFYKSMD